MLSAKNLEINPSSLYLYILCGLFRPINMVVLCGRACYILVGGSCGNVCKIENIHFFKGYFLINQSYCHSLNIQV